MEEDNLLVLSIVIPLVVIIGGCVLIGLAIYRFTRLKELAIRERLAMIEKGLVPSPERDPERFEEVMRARRAAGRGRDHGIRMRTGGVLLMGVGAGLGVLIAFAGADPYSGLGVGGGIAILGLAFFLGGFMSGGSPSFPERPAPPGEAPNPANQEP
jgi:hypothetical protein